MKKPHSKTIVGVMGSTESSQAEDKRAYRLGSLIAKESWVTMTGGSSKGIMHETLRGAKDNGGLTMGLLWGGKNTGNSYSEYIDIPVYTKMSSGRNYLNVLTADVLVIATKLTPGTLSEATLALVEQTPLIIIGASKQDRDFLKRKGKSLVTLVETPQQVINTIKKITA